MKQTFKIRFILLFAISLFFCSCITNRNLEYINTADKEVKSITYNYVIKKEDLLSVQISSTTKSEYDFFNLQETSNPNLLTQNPYLYGYLVKPDGLISLPMIGDVMVEGFTISEIESAIENIASTYFKDPIVKVNVINFKVSILGEVNSPGEYNIIRSNQNILHLIGKSNDLTDLANRKKIKIIRRNGIESTRVIYLDLTNPKLLNNKDIYLQPQDVVYVEPLNDFYAGFKSMSSVISLGISSITLYLLITNQ